MTKKWLCSNIVAMQKPIAHKRDRKPVAFDLACDLIADLDAWIGAQELPPTKRAVIETALREFLAKRWNVPKKRGAK